jgi:hypothetical protein
MSVIDPSLAEAVARSFCTARTLLGDPAQAEALVTEALGALHRVTEKDLRNLVVQRLVQLQLSGAH